MSLLRYRGSVAWPASHSRGKLTYLPGSWGSGCPLREALEEVMNAAGLVRRIGTNLNQAVARLNATGQPGRALVVADAEREPVGARLLDPDGLGLGGAPQQPGQRARRSTS